MKEYILFALFIAVLWGCSDEKTMSPINNKDTVDIRFETISGIVLTDIEGNTNDTLGNYNLNDFSCSNKNEYKISATPNISNDNTNIKFEVFNVQEVELTLENMLMSQDLIESLQTKGFGRYENQKAYDIRTVYKSILVKAKHIIEVDLSEKPAGAYLMKVLREGDQTSCIPIIISK